MFPCYENISEWDDFGEVINPDDYVIKEEDVDQTANNVSFLFKIQPCDFSVSIEISIPVQNDISVHIMFLF
jgi:hypothetical protein